MAEPVPHILYYKFYVYHFCPKRISKISKIIPILKTIKTLLFFPNANEVLVTEDLQFSQNTENHSRGASKWNVAEDVALMSAWCITSENNIVGKNRKISNLRGHEKKMYDADQAENPEKLSVRNETQMKGRFKRLSENA
ncbi:hypothetical protein R6Q57_012920 [Mikania cordata]